VKNLIDKAKKLHEKLLKASDLVGLEWSGFDPQIHSIRQKVGGAPGLQCSSRSNIYYK